MCSAVNTAATVDGRLDGTLAFDPIIGAMTPELGDVVGLVTSEQKRERAVRK